MLEYYIMVESEKEIKIRASKESLADDRTFRLLAQNLFRGIEAREAQHQEMSTTNQWRRAVRGVLYSLFGNSSDLVHGIQQRVSHYASQQEVEAYFRRSMKELREKSQLVTAEQNEKTVGTAGWKNIGKDPKTGNDVWEIVHVSVLPEARGSRIASRLMTQAQQTIASRDPQAPIVIRSSDRGVLEWAKKRGFQPMSFIDLWKIEHPGWQISEGTLEFHQKRDADQNDTKVYVLYPARKDS